MARWVEVPGGVLALAAAASLSTLTLSLTLCLLLTLLPSCSLLLAAVSRLSLLIVLLIRRTLRCARWRLLRLREVIGGLGFDLWFLTRMPQAKAIDGLEDALCEDLCMLEGHQIHGREARQRIFTFFAAALREEHVDQVVLLARSEERERQAQAREDLPELLLVQVHHQLVEAVEQARVALRRLAGQREEADEEVAQIHRIGEEVDRLEDLIHVRFAEREQGTERGAAHERHLLLVSANAREERDEVLAIGELLVGAALERVEQRPDGVDQLLVAIRHGAKDLEQPERTLVALGKDRLHGLGVLAAKDLVEGVEVDQVIERLGEVEEVSILAHDLEEALVELLGRFVQPHQGRLEHDHRCALGVAIDLACLLQKLRCRRFRQICAVDRVLDKRRFILGGPDDLPGLGRVGEVIALHQIGVIGELEACKAKPAAAVEEDALFAILVLEQLELDRDLLVVGRELRAVQIAARVLDQRRQISAFAEQSSTIATEDLTRHIEHGVIVLGGLFFLDDGCAERVEQIIAPELLATAHVGERPGGRLDRDRVRGRQDLPLLTQLQDDLVEQVAPIQQLTALARFPHIAVERRAVDAGLVAAHLVDALVGKRRHRDAVVGDHALLLLCHGGEHRRIDLGCFLGLASLSLFALDDGVFDLVLLRVGEVEVLEREAAQARVERWCVETTGDDHDHLVGEFVERLLDALGHELLALLILVGRLAAHVTQLVDKVVGAIEVALGRHLAVELEEYVPHLVEVLDLEALTQRGDVVVAHVFAIRVAVAALGLVRDRVPGLVDKAHRDAKLLGSLDRLPLRRELAEGVERRGARVVRVAHVGEEGHGELVLQVELFDALVVVVRPFDKDRGWLQFQRDLSEHTRARRAIVTHREEAHSKRIIPVQECVEDRFHRFFDPLLGLSGDRLTTHTSSNQGHGVGRSHSRVRSNHRASHTHSTNRFIRGARAGTRSFIWTLEGLATTGSGLVEHLAARLVVGLPVLPFAALDHLVEVKAQFLQILGVLFERRADDVVDDVIWLDRGLPEVVGVQARRISDFDSLGRAHHCRQRFNRLPAQGLSRAELVERGHEKFGSVLGEAHGDTRALEATLHLRLDQLALLLQVLDGVDRLEVEAALERGAHFVDAAVARVRRGDHVKARARIERALGAVELGDLHDAVRQDRQERILDLERTTRDLLETHQLAFVHAAVERRLDHGRWRRAFAQEQGVVPRVLDVVLGGACAPLNDERRISRDRCREDLAQITLRRAGLADKHQAAVGRQRHHAALDKAARSHELVHDVELLIPQHELDHRVGRHRPTERFRFALVVFDQARDLVRVEHLHRRALELLDFNLLLLSHSFFSLIASGESWAQVIHLENSYALASLSTSFLA